MQVSQAITRKSASNLALAFVLLPRTKREAMAALYAFGREVDDIADDPSLAVEERCARLGQWRADIQTACSGNEPKLAVNRELQRVMAQYPLPFPLFDELLQGVEMDLTIDRYETFEELEHYCYRVASVVGLLSIEIFGYRDAGCRDYAVYLGKALQLTNILRDVRADALRGRIYLPLAELRRCGVSPDEVLKLQYSPRFSAAAEAVAGRARHFYRQARAALPAIDRKSMATAELMGSVYWRLLRKLEGDRFAVFGPSVMRLNKCQKLFLIARSWCRASFGMWGGTYGRS